MIVSQEIARIAQSLLKDSTASLVEATWQRLAPLNLTPGQLVRGEVMANLPQSRYLVRVANELLKMELPLNLEPGQAVELTFVSEEPRLLFALSREANSGVPVRISETGRWLNQLANEGNTPAPATPLPRTSIVLPAPPRDPAVLAEGLKNALSSSGLFYESHLAEWVRGDRPLAELLKEPQGTLSRLAASLPAEAEPAATPTPPRQQSPEGSSRGDSPVAATPNRQPGQTPSPAPSTGGPETAAWAGRSGETAAAERGAPNPATSAPPQDAVEPRTIPIIREQLAALTSGEFAWIGQLWPGQTMEWKVQEREAGGGGREERPWQTELCIAFPRLGEVVATLRLTGEGIAVNLVAAEEETVAILAKGEERLRENMEAAGIRLSGLATRHGGE